MDGHTCKFQHAYILWVFVRLPATKLPFLKKTGFFKPREKKKLNVKIVQECVSKRFCFSSLQILPEQCPLSLPTPGGLPQGSLPDKDLPFDSRERSLCTKRW